MTLLAKGGWFCLRQNRGDKRLAGFHMGLFFQEVPTVNPSVTATPCQLPLAREPRAVPADNFARWLSANRYFPDPPGIVSAVVVEAQTKAPLAKGGCLGLPRRGDSAGWQVSTWVCSIGKCQL